MMLEVDVESIHIYIYVYIYIYIFIFIYIYNIINFTWKTKSLRFSSYKSNFLGGIPMSIQCSSKLSTIKMREKSKTLTMRVIHDHPFEISRFWIIHLRSHAYQLIHLRLKVSYVLHIFQMVCKPLSILPKERRLQGCACTGPVMVNWMGVFLVMKGTVQYCFNKALELGICTWHSLHSKCPASTNINFTSTV